MIYQFWAAIKKHHKTSKKNIKKLMQNEENQILYFTAITLHSL